METFFHIIFQTKHILKIFITYYVATLLASLRRGEPRLDANFLSWLELRKKNWMHHNFWTNKSNHVDPLPKILALARVVCVMNAKTEPFLGQNISAQSFNLRQWGCNLNPVSPLQIAPNLIKLVDRTQKA